MNKGFEGPIALFTTIVVLLTSLAATIARADDATTEIPIAQVPRAVMETVKRKFPDARLQSASRGVDDNKPFYDVFIKVREQNIWLTCDPVGTLLIVDREIPHKDLPKPVSDALMKKYPKAIVRSVNEITEGKEKSYDIALTFNRKNLIAIFEASGQFVGEMEDDEPPPSAK